MSTVTPIYKLMEINSRDLVIPEVYQRRLNSNRVARIVTGFDERIANEPKVSFRDDSYFVFDGQHTISARKKMNSNDDLPILCKVYYDMTEDEESRLFAMQTGESAELTPSAKLRANLHGNDPDSLAFIAATEKAGLHIGYERAEGNGRITCISTAFGEFMRVGADIYTEALTVMQKAWGGIPESLRADLVQGVVKFVALYHDTYNRDRLIQRLSDFHPTALYISAMADKTFKGKKKYVSMIHRIYNNGNKKGTLPIRF